MKIVIDTNVLISGVFLAGFQEKFLVLLSEKRYH